MAYPVWKDVIPDDEIRAYEAAGFGRPSGVGQRPALLIIDVQYRTMGTHPLPFWESIKEFPTSCGDVGWQAVERIEQLVTQFRERGWPIIYPYVAPKEGFDTGRLAAKVPALMNIAAKGYEFIPNVAPQPGDILLPKRHPSAFFGTPLASYLVERAIDTLVVTGCTTSGCVRGSVVDGFSLNYRCVVPHDAVYDRSQTSHLVNLFDMGSKYADVLSTDQALSALGQISPTRSA